MTALTLEQANTIVAGALAAQQAANAKPIAVAVLNPDGHVISLQRQDGASMFRNEIALGKAWGTVAMGAGGRTLKAKAANNPGFYTALAAASAGKLVPQTGGVLVRDEDGGILGAVGISGDTGENDEAFAVAGIEAAGLAPDTGG